MARKGYWLRNGAILFFGLTLFFFVMLPKSQPNLHDNIPVGKWAHLFLQLSPHCRLSAIALYFYLGLLACPTHLVDPYLIPRVE